MLINLQLLRFLAASLVVLYHTSKYLPRLDEPLFVLFAFGSATGFAGVDLFFLISGFIMAYTTQGKFGAVHGWEFARRRIARIYSGYWPFFLLALAVFLRARPEHFEESHLVASFFLWPQPLNHNLLEISWTLSFEMYFYLLFALLVWMLPPARRLAPCVLMLSAVVLFNAWRHLVLDSFGPEKLYELGFWDQFLSSPYIAEFFAGAVAAYWLEKRPVGLAWTWLVLGIGLFVTGGLVNEQLYDGLIEQGHHVVPRVAIFGSASAMILAGLVRIEHLGFVAPARFSLLAGGGTYAIYLLHVPILVLLHWLGMT